MAWRGRREGWEGEDEPAMAEMKSGLLLCVRGEKEEEEELEEK